MAFPAAERMSRDPKSRSKAAPSRVERAPNSAPPDSWNFYNSLNSRDFNLLGRAENHGATGIITIRTGVDAGGGGATGIITKELIRIRQMRFE